MFLFNFLISLEHFVFTYFEKKILRVNALNVVNSNLFVSVHLMFLNVLFMLIAAIVVSCILYLTFMLTFFLSQTMETLRTNGHNTDNNATTSMLMVIIHSYID